MPERKVCPTCGHDMEEHTADGCADTPDGVLFCWCPRKPEVKRD
jgi:hypothetical protein